MAKRIKLRIFPDGVKGKACTSYVSILEELLNAKTVDSSYTPEYYESESVQVSLAEQERIKGG
jgi:hypothetical protein